MDLSSASQKSKRFAAEVATAAGYDVRYFDADLIRQVITKPTTRSVINADNDLTQVKDILGNGHLLYLSDHAGKDVVLTSIQKNHNRWWEKQTTNWNKNPMSDGSDGIRYRIPQVI